VYKLLLSFSSLHSHSEESTINLNPDTELITHCLTPYNTVNMSEAVTFSAAEQALCIAVLKQIEVGKVNYELLRKELGLATTNAAQVRWSRFNTKLKGKKSGKKASDTPPATPKSKGAPRGKKGSSNKKRKIESSDEEDEVNTPNTSQDEMKDEAGDGDGDITMEAAETPTRKLPLKGARVMSFKKLLEQEEEASDIDEGQEEADDEKEEFIDSGHGGTPEAVEDEGNSDEEV
jgi:hypothetical protein